jgi:ketosteroid isomerase-like protein
MNISDSVRAAMQQTNELFDSAVIKKGQIDALDKVFTADARILPPGAGVIEGREAIKGFWKQAVAALGLSAVKLTTVDAQVVGENVFEVGQADLTVGDGQVISAKYVVLWKQEDGAWKWQTDIWNLNS